MSLGGLPFPEGKGGGVDLGKTGCGEGEVLGGEEEGETMDTKKNSLKINKKLKREGLERWLSS